MVLRRMHGSKAEAFCRSRIAYFRASDLIVVTNWQILLRVLEEEAHRAPADVER